MARGKHYSTEMKKRIGAKIAHLVKDEGKTPEQATGAAYGMADDKRLGEGGKYKAKKS